MKPASLHDLQASLSDTTGFRRLEDYQAFCLAYLALFGREQPTRIVSPSHAHYIFYQYAPDHGHAITRPLNTQLFFESRRSSLRPSSVS